LAATPAAAITLAVPRTILLDTLEPPVAAAFSRALSRLSAAGCRLVDVAMPPLRHVGLSGGIALAEAFAWHRELLATRKAGYDPFVAKQIEPGAAIDAAEYRALLEARRRLSQEMHAITRPYTAVVCPTVPIVAPPIAGLLADEAVYDTANQRALRNTIPANTFDRCAISLPCHEAGTAPVGLMLMGEHMADDALLRAALTVEAILSG
jgi:aspartyl-tRNA(Asn)/glutamyl-tRNA(Gln) amidotransferase subunit A